MKALVVARPGMWSVAEVPEPTPLPHEVVIRPKAVGICGSDLHLLAGEFPPTPFPIIPGHEFAGVVEEAGPSVTGIQRGDRVAIDPSLFCGRCRFCLAGRGNLCETWGAVGDTVNGALAELVAVPAASIYRLSDRLSFAAGALIEPLSCVVHGLHRLNVTPGGDALVVGGGSIGLMMVQSLRAIGVLSVDLVDVESSRLGRAHSFGAHAAATDADSLLSERGTGYEYVIEATGHPDGVLTALRAVDRGGKVLVFGVAAEDARAALSPFDVYNREITILGSMAVLNSFGPAVRLMEAGRIDASRFVSHSFALDDFGDALEVVRSRRGLKVQIHFE